MSVLEKLGEIRGLTNAERTVARFIITHPDEATGLTIAELADRTYTSNASIIRLCRKLGLDGYRSFRIQLAADLERKRAAPTSIGVDRPIYPGERSEVVMSRLAILMKEAIGSCYAAVSPKDIARAAQTILDARGVFVYAMGDSQTSAEAFANMMVKLGVHVFIANQFSETIAVTSAIKEDDAAIIISYSGKIMNADLMSECYALLTQRTGNIIWISHAVEPPGVSVSIRFPAREADAGKVATFYSQTCIRYILNCLYGAAYALSPLSETNHKHLIDDIDLALSLQPLSGDM